MLAPQHLIHSVLNVYMQSLRFNSDICILNYVVMDLQNHNFLIYRI